MTQGKKCKIDFEVAFIGISWTLILLMFAVSLTSCDNEQQCTTDDGIYCIDRNFIWSCQGGEWKKGFPPKYSYCENNIIIEDTDTCIEGEEIDYVCATYYCISDDVWQKISKDCDPESILPQ